MNKPAIILACAAALAHPAAAGTAPAEVPIEAPGPQGALAGTMARSIEGEGPVALIIPGSGPTDRDGNSPMGIAAASYRLLAQGLAANGITTVRIDKRGMFGSDAAVADANAVTIADYVSDIATWVRRTREETGTPCVWLIGHSEGGLVSLAAAQEVPGLCGLVLIAAPGKPMGEVIRAQLRANPANASLLPAAEIAIDRLTAGEKVEAETLPQPLLPLFGPAVQDYLISAFALDPSELAKRADLPMLIVQGGKDLQVPAEDARRLAAANPSAVLEILPDANHVLKDVAGSSPADNLVTYGNPDLPLAEAVVPTIAGFIRR
ncbi:alpha/beta hydrolase [Porphyrobacter sp. CACIAM 03H1]|uniref:alpha/beta hydrolase n=1 Tax=Porphyrobacter sp. CACIAM 03H1 TaxID=2003315 RepID=UPI000B5A82C8|nr:alpha/beta fold hydrolase [Porphyrobacter sp. CACIAM 03H1]ASJ90954.1 alpha/beta hydrolase [Porphyrobacter sp. CACIAM 03H1]